MNPDTVDIGTILTHEVIHRGTRQYVVTGQTRASWLVQELHRREVRERLSSDHSRLSGQQFGPEVSQSVLKVTKGTLTSPTRGGIGCAVTTLARFQLDREAAALAAHIIAALKVKPDIEQVRAIAAILGV